MGNTSATGGFLVATVVPAPQTVLEDALHNLIAALAGLDAQMVRPRWQPSQPKQPPLDASWCAFGLQTVTPEENAYEEHRADGSHLVSQHEEIEALLSFFGADAVDRATLVRMGIHLGQNREAMRSVGLVLASVSAIRRVPSLTGETWVNRADIEFTLRRQVVTIYDVLNIAGAKTILLTDIERGELSGVLTDPMLDGVLTIPDADGVLTGTGGYRLHRDINTTP